MATHYGDINRDIEHEALNDDAMALLLQQFMDDWTYRVMASPLSKKWHKLEVNMSALELLAVHGVPYTEEEIKEVAKMEEQMMIMDMTARMSVEVRGRFEQITRHLRDLVSTATAIRKGVDVGEEAVQEIFEGLGDTLMGQQIMKNTVISATEEVQNLQRCQKSWKKSMEIRLGRLTRSAELAEHAQQQLLAVEAQLEAVGGDSNGKSKKVLQGLAAGQNKSLMHTCFTNWLGVMLGDKADQDIRHKYEARLALAEKKLFAFKENKVKNIKAVLGRASKGNDDALQAEVLRLWKIQKDENKMDGDAKAKMKILQDKLAHAKKSAAENTKKVMARMNGDKDEMLLVSAISAMKSYCAEYEKNKEFEDAVKKSEQNMKDHLAKKKDEAKKVLDSMHNATASGLMEHCFHAWAKDIEETVRRKKLEEAMYETDCRLKSFLDKQAGNAMGVQTRTIDQMNENMTLRIWSAWVIEVKGNHLEKYYSKKLEGKRGQLQKVQQLFKKFAEELEQGLGNIEGDSSRNATGRKSKGMIKGGDGSVSLPDIRTGSGRRPA
jgi:hypothetical protein